MFKQIPVKNEYLLIAGTAIILFLGYQLAFKQTIAAWQTHKTLHEKLTVSADLTYQPAYLERKNQNLAELLSQYKVDTALLRNNIINTISTLAEIEHVKLIEVPVQDISNNTDHFILEKLNFEGDFFSLLKLANKLQTAKNIGMVRSESWKKIVDRSHNTEVKRLVLEIYMEVVK